MFSRKNRRNRATNDNVAQVEVPKEVGPQPMPQSEVVQLSALDKERITELQQMNVNYTNLCSQIGAKEVELITLKEQAKQMYFTIVGNQQKLDFDIKSKYGDLAKNESGELVKVNNSAN